MSASSGRLALALFPALVAWGGALGVWVWTDQAEARLDGAEREVAAAEAKAAATLGPVGATGVERRRLATLEARAAARKDASRHLRLDLSAGTGELWEGDFPLRRFPIEVGPDETVGDLRPPDPFHPDAARVLPAAVPPGIYTVSGAWGPHEVATVVLPDPEEHILWPDGGADPVALWDAAAFGGAVLYSATPSVPATLGAARPGTVRVGEIDLMAVMGTLTAGTRVYVW